MKSIKDNGNIIFLDKKRWAFHEAAFREWGDDGMPVYESDGKKINIKDIFLWCTRYDLLMSTNFVHFIHGYPYPIRVLKKRCIMNFDYEELACIICGLDYDEVCEDCDEWEIITNVLEEKFGVDYDIFEEIANVLIDYTPVVNTALSHIPVHGFGVEEGDNLFRFVVKKKVK